MNLAEKLVVGGLVTAGLVVAAVEFFEDSGDTPIIVIGGSLTFKEGNKGSKWTPDSDKQYHIDPGYKVGAIVVKANSALDTGEDPVPDDSTSKTDRIFVDVSQATSWQVDEFTSDSDLQQPVVKITSTPSTSTIINLILNSGFFCDENKKHKRIDFGHDVNCTDPVKFTQVKVSVNGQEIGILDCFDQNNQVGICRVVFRKAK